jgi:ABC-type nitrate/sulfonate/bicarbonate transport system substrate-binding protein
MAAPGGPPPRPRRFLLFAERADGTGRMVYDTSDDRALLEERAARRATPRTRYWVEENPEAAQGRP